MKAYRVALAILILNISCVIADAMGVFGERGVFVPELARVSTPSTGGILATLASVVRWAITGARLLFGIITSEPVAALLRAFGMPAVLIWALRTIFAFILAAAIIQIASGRLIEG